MPTATVSKSTAAPKARKTRTRKAPAPVSKVTTTTFVAGKVTQKTSEFTRPASANLISPERYLKDIATRWQIHQFEIQELVKDVKRGFDFATPYYQTALKQVKSIQLPN